MKNYIEQLRKENKVSQEQLADAMNISRQSINSIEKGRSNPSVLLALRIARYFELSVEDVFSLEGSWRIVTLENPPKNILALKNFRYNISDYSHSGLILGQANSQYTALRYGKCQFSFNGGEIAAVYNAMHLLGLKIGLCELIAEFEENSLAVLSGFAGTDPHRLGEALEGYGIDYIKYTDPVMLMKNLRQNSIFILSYRMSNILKNRRSLHTIAGRIVQSGAELYNITDNQKEVKPTDNLPELIKNRLICGYVIR